MTLRRLSCGNCCAGLLVLLVLGVPVPASASYVLDSVSTGHPIIEWFPVDVDDDGIWELAIAFNYSGSQVGIFSAQSRDWLNGPIGLPVESGKWGVSDADDDNEPEYIYLRGDTLRGYYTSNATEVALRSLPFQPFGLEVFGRTGQGAPIVGLSKSYDFDTMYEDYGFVQTRGYSFWYTHLFELQGGGFIDSLPGTPFRLALISGYFAAGENSLITWQHQYQWSDALLGRNDTFVDSLHIFSSEWHPIRNHGYRSLTMWRSGPPQNEYLAHFTSCPATSDLPGCIVFEMADSNYPDGSSQLLCAKSDTNAILWNRQVPSPYQSPYRDFAIFDLDDNGIRECYLPVKGKATWEVRELDSGHVAATLVGMPEVDLQTGPLLVPGEQNLFYVNGATLYFYRPESPTGIFDDPETPQDRTELSISVHPNPFNSAVSISWPSGAPATSLTIHNILGQTVRTLDESALSGNSTITWDGLDGRGQHVASGVYFARLVTGDQVATAKLVLLR